MNIVIVGSGIAGLSAAAAVSPYCKQIILIDKDQPATPNAPRRYAPQGAHIHILLQAGLNMLDDMLPGFEQELIRRGASRIPAGVGQQIFEYGDWMPQQDLDLVFLGQSRMHFESTLCERVLSLPNVSRINRRVAGFLKTDNNRIAGVNFVEGDELEADLVIDASGAGGIFFDWFKKNTQCDIKVDIFPINIFYSTVHFKKPPEFQGKKENILIVPEAGVSNLGCSLLDIENDTWCVSLHGRDREPIPATLGEWQEAVKNLPDDRIWSRISNAIPLTELSKFKKATAKWRRFDEAQGLPEGYLPLGDTINTLNPIFGQGMTLTIGHAFALRNTVAASSLTSSDEFRRRYLTEACEWTAKAWRKAVAFDKNFLADQIQDSKRVELVRKLTAAQHRKMAESADFHLKIVKEYQMLV
ncbi:2-polyprenyl-6-methoxyphenol hydroxylase-like FAD-dependent oxidoreductase [Alteromonadaceae bacterium 2753L.S.0a.02]|nr:2-polyprenyl-6-methoxyphenol hydroxylase-like FAD-dependent oxidoreductase [Alteromonadaceae bacterium 2753L.S.0a.02]